MATHFCGDRAVKSEFTLGSSDLSCGMKNNQACSENANSASLDKKNCCHNQQLSLNVDDDFQTQLLDVQLDVCFIHALVYTYLFPFSTEQTEHFVFVFAPPPPKKQNKQVLFQSFLI